MVGFLAEYDALSGLSQKAGCPVQEAVQEGGAGHGCGHNLLGAGCYAAAVALKDYLIKEKKDGTVIFFGCPAEEGAGSKQFIARAGYFDKWICLHLAPGDRQRSGLPGAAWLSWAPTSPLTASPPTPAESPTWAAVPWTPWS